MSRPPGSRALRKARTRQQLERAALDVFAEHGFADASIAAITRRAGVAHGTFYVHFPSKEALLDQLLADFNDGFAQRVAEHLALAGAADVPSFVAWLASSFLAYWDEHAAFVRAYAGRASAGLAIEELRDGINPPMAALVARLLQTASAQAAPGTDLDLATQALLALWLRVGLQVVLGDRVDHDAAATTLTRMTLGAVRALLPDLPEEP